MLFLDGRAAMETAALLAEEGGPWPPLFQVGNSSVPGTVLQLDPVGFGALRRHLGE